MKTLLLTVIQGVPVYYKEETYCYYSIEDNAIYIGDIALEQQESTIQLALEYALYDKVSLS